MPVQFSSVNARQTEIRMSTLPRALLHIKYAESAQAYLRSLPPEHFMEAIAQATQRKITLESLDLVHARRADVQVFNELLVQYPLKNQRDIGKVVPDNMVVVWPEAIDADGSYDLPFQPARPFWVLECVSKHNKRKDYEESFEKYERQLKVPYYLVFYPDAGELTLYRHNGRKYVSVKPNAQERYAIPELEIELGLVDGWVRYWRQGELLPLPADLQKSLDETRQRLVETTHRLARSEQHLNETRQQLDQTKRQLDEVQLEAEREREARLATERELAALRARFAQQDPGPK